MDTLAHCTHVPPTRNVRTLGETITNPVMKDLRPRYIYYFANYCLAIRAIYGRPEGQVPGAFQ